MTQIANPYKTRNSRSELPPGVDLTPYVRELVDAKFEYYDSELKNLRTINEQQTALLQQLVANTKYPLKPYTVKDFEAMFGLGVRAQQKYRKEEKLGFIKLGETVFYTHQHILDFIALHDSTNKKTKN
jgi:hypothetical protein